MRMKVELLVEVEVAGDTLKSVNKVAKDVANYELTFAGDDATVKRVLAVTTASKPKGK